MGSVSRERSGTGRNAKLASSSFVLCDFRGWAWQDPDVPRAPRGSTGSDPCWPRIPDFEVYFAVRISEPTYCADYETVVLDEIDDPMSAASKEVEVAREEKQRVV